MYRIITADRLEKQQLQATRCFTMVHSTSKHKSLHLQQQYKKKYQGHVIQQAGPREKIEQCCHLLVGWHICSQNNRQHLTSRDRLSNSVKRERSNTEYLISGGELSIYLSIQNLLLESYKKIFRDPKVILQWLSKERSVLYSFNGPHRCFCKFLSITKNDVHLI